MKISTSLSLASIFLQSLLTLKKMGEVLWIGTCTDQESGFKGEGSWQVPVIEGMNFHVWI